MIFASRCSKNVSQSNMQFFLLFPLFSLNVPSTESFALQYWPLPSSTSLILSSVSRPKPSVLECQRNSPRNVVRLNKVHFVEGFCLWSRISRDDNFSIQFNSSSSIYTNTKNIKSTNEKTMNEKIVNYVPPLYQLDENCRPIDARGYDLLLVSHQPSPTDDERVIHGNTETANGKMYVNLQTPHSGRKFKPAHPSRNNRPKMTMKFLSLPPWFLRRKAASIENSNLTMAGKTKSWMQFFRRTNRRFTEGWYYRLTIPELNESFVFIFSIEDAGRWIRSKTVSSGGANCKKNSSKILTKLKNIVKYLKIEYVKSPLTLACMQLIGPKDTYLVQSDDDDSKFWGWKYSQGFGCTFEWKNGTETSSISAMLPEEVRERVKSGFQILPFHIQGSLNGHDGTLGGVKFNEGVPGTAVFDMTILPVAGWGNYPPMCSDDFPSNKVLNDKNHYRQYSTAGWLASLPVFEPHWQVTMANARATGTINWNGTLYEFQNAPFYGEKNWGGAFPTKWFWAQCNSFDTHQDLAFTAGGGIRKLPLSIIPDKKTETLGLIGIHYQGIFYEIVPWTGEMEWKVWPWGRWEFRGKCTNKNGKLFEAEVVAKTNDNIPGVLLRAPTKDAGMQYFCRDSCYGDVVLSLWHLEWNEDLADYVRASDKEPIIDQAHSSQCAVEVGGGPWWDVWTVSSKMSRPLKWIVRFPYLIRNSIDYL